MTICACVLRECKSVLTFSAGLCVVGPKLCRVVFARQCVGLGARNDAVRVGERRSRLDVDGSLRRRPCSRDAANTPASASPPRSASQTSSAI